MEKLINKIMGYLGAFTQEQWLWLGLAGLIVGYVLYNRKKFVQIFEESVIMAETSFNKEESQKKLEAAVKYVIDRTNTLPLPARLVLQKFVSKKRIVDLIEKALQKYSNVFGTGRKVDIKGNE